MAVALIDDDFWHVRRKLKGACGASCRGAPYLRMRPTPCNPNTRRQQECRALWSRLGYIWWNVLDAYERSEWDYWAEEDPWYDSLEQYRWLCGYERFAAYVGRQLMAGLDLKPRTDQQVAGMELDSLSVTLLSSTTLRATWTTVPGSAYWCLALYGRVGLSLGEAPVVQDVEWWRDAVPNGWRWLGRGDLGGGSPTDITLPVEVRGGTKVVVIGCLMGQAGWVPDDWVMAEAAA